MEYTTKGTCSRKILFEVEDGKVHNVQFVGGCNGNTQGVARLVEGMDVNEAISRMKGIDCNGRGTSCPDQLAKSTGTGYSEITFFYACSFLIIITPRECSPRGVCNLSTSVFLSDAAQLPCRLLSSGFSSILIAQSFFQPPDCFICPICRRDC